LDGDESRSLDHSTMIQKEGAVARIEHREQLDIIPASSPPPFYPLFPLPCLPPHLLPAPPLSAKTNEYEASLHTKSVHQSASYRTPPRVCLSLTLSHSFLLSLSLSRSLALSLSRSLALSLVPSSSIILHPHPSCTRALSPSSPSFTLRLRRQTTGAHQQSRAQAALPKLLHHIPCTPNPEVFKFWTRVCTLHPKSFSHQVLDSCAGVVCAAASALEPSAQRRRPVRRLRSVGRE